MAKSTLLKIVAISLLLIATCLVSVGCSTSKGSDQSKEDTKLKVLRASGKYKEKEIEVGDNYFSPKLVTIKPNTIVIFKNAGLSIHNVMGADKKTLAVLNSDNIGRSETYVALFTKEGEYSYYCHFHGGPKRGQYGIITVKS